MALTKNGTTIIASASNAAGATTRGTIDLSAVYGGIVTIRIINGATGPTAQCEGRVLISHADTLPTAASAGADWKTIWRFGGGTTNSAITEQSFQFGPEVRHLEVEFAGNTGQAVTVEAIASTYTV
ncbi:hypothetical protein C667_02813 [Thauera phenylacetica B4P]|uniref:Uncharacterized protein n=1 Tax=Thauera phenylacetica B4P TaxID=1234382 RepID=N6YWF2_9RHOO|nr:hypothetical protein [Thauera phenylacetica]ENO98601.1 hypothetical protein C667_02813 [Thauera phenylacetica B4P]